METGSILVGVTVTLLTYVFYKYFIKIYDYWSKKGIPCVEGALPIFGNTLSVLLLRKDQPGFAKDLYDTYRNRSMVGFYQNQTPNLLLRDPELIKAVLISNFSSFQVNFLTIDPKLDPIVAKNPFFITGEEWKKRRSYLSNALMSSKKLKVLCSTVTKVCDKFTKYLDDNVKKSNGVYEVETKELFTRFTGEVVSGVGFGVEGEFFSHKDNPNSFKEIVKGIFDNTLVLTLIFVAPALNKLLRLSFLPKRVDQFFTNITSQMIAERREDGIARDDFLQLMLDAHTKKEGEFDESDITASATSFFLDGYETSAITLLLFSYQVAVNPDVQEKLRREVDDVLEKHSGVISYDSLAAMTYMDQALNESMRINPAFGLLVKRCNEKCKLVGSDGIECVVEPGTDVVLPIEELQNDSKYWENPEKYDPGRFDPECKNDRLKTVFLPFGEGPRICVGMRFAMMQIKASMATILRRFKIEISSKTKLPPKIIHTPLKAVEGGLWIKFKPL